MHCSPLKIVPAAKEGARGPQKEMTKMDIRKLQPFHVKRLYHKTYVCNRRHLSGTEKLIKAAAELHAKRIKLPLEHNVEVEFADSDVAIRQLEEFAEKGTHFP